MYFDFLDFDLKIYCIGIFCLFKCILYFIFLKCVILNCLNVLKERIWYDLDIVV